MFLISGFTAYRNVKFILGLFLKPILWRLSDRAVATASCPPPVDVTPPTLPHIPTPDSSGVDVVSWADETWGRRTAGTLLWTSRLGAPTPGAPRMCLCACVEFGAVCVLGHSKHLSCRNLLCVVSWFSFVRMRDARQGEVCARSVQRRALRPSSTSSTLHLLNHLHWSNDQQGSHLKSCVCYLCMCVCVCVQNEVAMLQTHLGINDGFSQLNSVECNAVLPVLLHVYLICALTCK